MPKIFIVGDDKITLRILDATGLSKQSLGFISLYEAPPSTIVKVSKSLFDDAEIKSHLRPALPAKQIGFV